MNFRLKTAAALAIVLYGLLTLMVLIVDAWHVMVLRQMPGDQLGTLSVAALIGLGFALPAAIFQLRGYPYLRSKTWMIHFVVQAVMAIIVCVEYMRLEAPFLEIVTLGIATPGLGLTLTGLLMREKNTANASTR